MTRIFRRSHFMGALFFAIAGAALLLATTPWTRASEPALPRGSGISSWHENGSQGRYVVELLAGTLPAAAAGGLHGTVMTDADCAPDAQGLNHCHNVIVLDDAARVTVINHHQMSRHHCLRPGESVRMTPLVGHWATVQTLD